MVLVIIAVAQLLAQQFWWIEVFTSFTAHAIPLLFITAIVLRNKHSVLFAVSGIILTVWAVSPLSLLQKKHPSEQPIFTAVMANVFINNENPHDNISQLTQHNPDVLVLIEAGGKWQRALRTLKKNYTYGCEHLEDSPFALQLYAKTPLQSCTVYFSNDLAYIRAETTVLKKDNTSQPHIIYALHPPPPISAQRAHNRNQYLATVAQKIQAETQPVLVVGDLNVTPYSPIYRDFVSTAELRATVPFVTPTWFLLMLHLDHVLVKDIADFKTATLAANGSDHYGLKVELY